MIRWLMEEEGLESISGLRGLSLFHQFVYCLQEASRHHWPPGRIIKHYPFVSDWRFVMTARHPYERVVSEFKYQLSGNRSKEIPEHKTLDINSAVINGNIWRAAYPYHDYPLSEYYVVSGEVIRCESFEEDFLKVFGGSGVPEKKNVSPPDLEIVLNEEAKSKIAEKWGADFKLFDYEVS